MTSNASFAKLPWPGEYKFVQVTTKGLWNSCFRLFDGIFPRDTEKNKKHTWISVFIKDARNCLVARFFQKLISSFAGLTEFFLAILQQFKEIFPFPFQNAFLRMLMKCPTISRFVFVWKKSKLWNLCFRNTATIKKKLN